MREWLVVYEADAGEDPAQILWDDIPRSPQGWADLLRAELELLGPAYNAMVDEFERLSQALAANAAQAICPDCDMPESNCCCG